MAIAAASIAPADELAPPTNVEAGGEAIDTGGVGYAAPYYADFDGDGVKDLLLGEFFEGRLRIYKNLGTNDRPRFKDFVFFQDGAETGRIPAG